MEQRKKKFKGSLKPTGGSGQEKPFHRNNKGKFNNKLKDKVEEEVKTFAGKGKGREMVTAEEKIQRIKNVELNKEISQCADRKELNKAMTLFDSATEKNSHTYASILNVCVRCGEMATAIRIFKEMMSRPNFKFDLVCCTTMMKGYCAEGDVFNSLLLLQDMVKQRPHPVYPNIRTVNTIMRGCVLIGDHSRALDLLRDMSSVYHCNQAGDATTWEHVVTLLTQALDLDRVFPIVGRLITATNASAPTGSAASASTATATAAAPADIAFSALYVCIARAAAMLHQWKSCTKYVAMARAALVAEEGGAGGATDGADKKAGGVRLSDQKVTGGKKAWNAHKGAVNSAVEGDSDEDNDNGEAGTSSRAQDARARSLLVYVQHRRAELQAELDGIERYKTKCTTGSGGGKDGKAAPVVAAEKLLAWYKRMFLFPHASLPPVAAAQTLDAPSSSTSASNKSGSKSKAGRETKSSKDVVEVPIPEAETKSAVVIEASAYDRVGMKAVCSVLRKAASGPEVVMQGSTKKRKAGEDVPAADVAANTATDSAMPWSDFGDYLHGSINATGKLDFDTIFNTADNAEQKSKKPLKLEICSGAGEWVVAQAKHDAEVANWIALELRFDRAYQTFSKAFFEDVTNLCVLRGDANTVVKDHISPRSMSHIFINHPEPPQQRGSSYSSTGKHLLTKEFFIDMERLLESNGMLTIVTDNVWYGKFLVNLLAASSNEIPLASGGSVDTANSSCSVCVQMGAFTLYQGKPGAAGGHVADASSYFDRLWHRENISERYFLLLQSRSGGLPSGGSLLSTLTAGGAVWKFSKGEAAKEEAEADNNKKKHKDKRSKTKDNKGGATVVGSLVTSSSSSGSGSGSGAKGGGGGGNTLKAVRLLSASAEGAAAAPVAAGASYLSSNNPRYSVKSSGTIVAVSANKKMTFDDDDEEDDA